MPDNQHHRIPSLSSLFDTTYFDSLLAAKVRTQALHCDIDL